MVKMQQETVLQRDSQNWFKELIPASNYDSGLFLQHHQGVAICIVNILDYAIIHFYPLPIAGFST